MKIIYLYSKHSVSILLLLYQKLGPFFDEKYFEELNFSFFKKPVFSIYKDLNIHFMQLNKYVLNI